MTCIWKVVAKYSRDHCFLKYNWLPVCGKPISFEKTVILSEVFFQKLWRSVPISFLKFPFSFFFCSFFLSFFLFFFVFLKCFSWKSISNDPICFSHKVLLTHFTALLYFINAWKRQKPLGCKMELWREMGLINQISGFWLFHCKLNHFFPMFSFANPPFPNPTKGFLCFRGD